MHLPLAWNPIGIGDTWTGALLPVAFLVVVIVIFFAKEKWDERSFRREAFEREPPAFRPVGRGVVLCDWVDEGVLLSVAQQKKAQLEPDEVETHDGASKQVRGSGGWGPIQLGASVERRSGQRQTIALDRDPNTLLLNVLRAIGDEALDRRLDVAPYLGRWADSITDDALEELVTMVREGDTIGNAKDAIQTLQGSQQRTTLADIWKQAAQKSTFVVIENRWLVEKVDSWGQQDAPDTLRLRLASLRSEEHSANFEYGISPDAPARVELPGPMAMTVTFNAETLTSQGARLTPGSTVEAGVFGTVGSYNDGLGPHLTVKPIAVYARVEDF